jgi:trehalose 6-phosphate synthase
MEWTQDRLEQLAHTQLRGTKLIVVANREPYIHMHRDGAIEWMRPAGGLTAALDPVMRTCGGVWVAHGSGDADREVTDARGRVRVPPDDPSYLLRRVWLTPGLEHGYYYGFANSALWPLCHQVYCRPTFDPSHWDAYREVNRRFAAAVLEEARGGPALVFVQDYHFALLPRLLKAARPDLVVAQFWHVPWPHPETFAVCPWAADLIAGMLGNDLLAFHTRRHCANFLETVDRTVECRIDREGSGVDCGGHTTLVRPHPISVDPGLAAGYLAGWDGRADRLRARLNLGDRPLLVGVDRLDYTKGIPERLRAVGRLLDVRPDLAGTFHFVQVGAPSRSVLPAYRELDAEVRRIAAGVNARHGTPGRPPVVFVNEHLGPEDVYALYRAAAGCVVSSLHDGMNLVAKEFVTARPDEQGVLVLSEFAGAARELTDAVVVNPFDVDALAGGLAAALTMPAEEQQRRMRKMRRQVEEHNIFRWAGRLLTEAGRLADDPPASGVIPTPSFAGASVAAGVP